MMPVDRDLLECAWGEMRFARRSPEEPLPPGAHQSDDNVSYMTCGVKIHDARPIVNELSLNREAFALVRHETAFADERNPEALRSGYLDEMVPFIKDYFKASLVVPKRDAVFVRRTGITAATAGTDVTSVRGLRTATVGHVHIDYAPIAGPMLAARENQLLGIPIRSYSRLMIINTWRAVSPPPQANSLAVCDSSSIADDDIVEADYTDPESGFTWKAASPFYSPHHRWYYFPDMKSNELLIFKGYDTEQNCKVAHAGFDNRHAYPNARLRESIEARFYVYHD